MLGYMPMPADFQHKALFYAGRPTHQKFDDFWCRHPSMDPGRRAKIFAPFDALKGFSDAIDSKKVRYGKKADLGDEAEDELNRRLIILQALTRNRKLACRNHIFVTVEYYVPCSDEQHNAFGCQGRYETVSGVCHNVDFLLSGTVQIGSSRIPLNSILSVESDTGLFDPGRLMTSMSDAAAPVCFSAD